MSEPSEKSPHSDGVIEAVLRFFPLRPVRRIAAVALHLAVAVAAYYAAFLLRFDGRVPAEFLAVFWRTLPVLAVISLLTFLAFDLYSGMLSYFSVPDLLRLGGAQAVVTVLFALTYYATNHWSFQDYPRSIFALHFMLMVGCLASVRLAVRFARERSELRRAAQGVPKERVLVAGDLQNADLLLRAGRAGIGRFVGIVSDSETCENQRFRGIRTYWAGADGVGRIAKNARADCILILPPFDRPQEINRIVESCSAEKLACQFRIVPSLLALASGRLTASSIRKVDIEDLLPREAANLDDPQVRRFVQGKKVLVTGAGGSIGSELCRQVAGYEPETLVLFDACEFALYQVDQDVRSRYPNQHVLSTCGDIRHPEEIRAAIRRAGGIDVIYHAAAYKHVPLMEENVAACFRTNVLGTARLAETAAGEHVTRVVMISSDKAVRPSSVMGATKRIAERIVAEKKRPGTSCVAVRFGNVLESSGSVVPLFKRLIAEGKPLPVTSPNVRRFFMTVREAVGLVLQAGVAGRNGDVMALEMGEAVRIADLARRLIELSGLVPDQDIRIEFTGLRPGEKEYEEVMTSDENVTRTAYDKIWVLRKNQTPPPKPSPAEKGELERVEAMVAANDEAGLRELARRYVPENTFPEPAGSLQPLVRFPSAPRVSA